MILAAIRRALGGPPAPGRVFAFFHPRYARAGRGRDWRDAWRRLGGNRPEGLYTVREADPVEVRPGRTPERKVIAVFEWRDGKVHHSESQP